MRKMKLTFALIFLLNLIACDNLVEDKYYIQLYPSDNKTKPYLSHFYKLNSEFYTVNSTEGENMVILNIKETMNETPIKKLSLVSKYDDFLIKTCFGPDKIVEIIDENNKILIPNDDYFKKVKNLENIEYCYTTAITNIYNVTNNVIITYWTERVESKGNKNYVHKSILFFPHNKTFSKVDTLDSKGKNYFAQSCTNLRNKYIYCNIDQSFALSKTHHFSVIPSFITKEEVSIIIRLVQVYNSSSISVYHKPIGTFKYFYSKIGKYVEYFLLECHDKQKNKTKLVTSAYVNINLNSFINQKDDIGVYNGINIEDQYIPPELFNSLIPNSKDLIIIYIMKNYKGKNLLILNNYDYNKELKTKTKFDKFSISNYLRDDICQNPKYIQSMFITSLIKYDYYDIEYFENNQQYYKYQRDIASIISCDDGNGSVFYQAKKIQMPQCLNVLNEINGMNDSLIFTKDNDNIILHINKDPNYKSLKEVEIEFEDSILYNRYIVVLGVQNGNRLDPIEKATTLYDIERLEFFRTMNFKPGRTIQIPYRIRQTGFNDLSTSCHLTSDLCYFQFHYEEPVEKVCKLCNIIENEKCSICEDITGLIPKDEGCDCQCNAAKGFNEEPNNDKKMCPCKKDYSFYKDISQCLPDTILKNTSFCIFSQDEKLLTYIYDDLTDEQSICYKDNLPFCCPKSISTSITTSPSDIPSTTPLEISSTSLSTVVTPSTPPSNCSKSKWFSMGQDIFYFTKVENCVYILYNNSLVMYSNRSDCDYIEDYDYKKCLEIDINNEADYYNALDKAYEYKPDDDNDTLKIEKQSNNSNIIFYLLNNYTEKNKSFSSVQLSQKCIEKVKEAYNLSYLLIFIANIKKENKISRQVEYSFYNPTPEYIYQEINISSFCYKPKDKPNNSTKRSLEVSEEFTYNDNYSADVDEILVNVQIDFNSEQGLRIKELSDNNINIFNSSEPFYNDVCFGYKTPEKTDIYLQERRNYYYIYDPLCENGCRQIGYSYDNTSYRIVCLCPIKGSTENFENVTFIPNELDENFRKNYTLPNIKVIKCIFKGKFHYGQILVLLLFIIFLIITFPNYRKTQESIYIFDNTVNNINDNNYKNIKIYHWEEPLQKFLNNDLCTKKQENIIEEPTNLEPPKDPEVDNGLRQPPPDQSSKSKKIKKGIKNESNNNKNNINSQSEISSKQTINVKSEVETKITETNINNEKETLLLNINKIKDKKEGESERKEEEDEKLSKYIDVYGGNDNKNEPSEIASEIPNLNEQSYSRDNNNNNISIYTNSSQKKNPANPPKNNQQSSDRDTIKTKRDKKKHKKKEEGNYTENENCKKYIYEVNKNFKSEDYNCWERFKAKFISENNIIYFVINFTRTYFGLRIKLLIIILYFAAYMFSNIIIEYNLSNLHMVYHNNKYSNSNSRSWIENMVPPCLIYLIIYYIKKILSIREFCHEEEENIRKLKKLEKKTKNINKIIIRYHKEKTNIKKFKSNFENSIQIISFIGSIFLFINFLLVTSFCGIYHNSFECILINMIVNMVSSFIIMSLLNIIVAIIKRDFKIYLFGAYMLFCQCTYLVIYYLTCKKFDEDFKEIDEDDEENNESEADDDKEKKN